MKTDSPLPHTLQAILSCLVALFLAGAAHAASTSVLTDVTSQVTVTFHSWTVSRSTGALSANVTILNTGTKALSQPFYFALPRTSQQRLALVTGTFTVPGTGQKLPYLNVTSQVLAALPRIGNKDLLLNKGESVTFAVSVFSHDRTPILNSTAHFLSIATTVSTIKRALLKEAASPTVTVTADESAVLAGSGCVSAVFSRTGSTSKDLTVYYWRSGDAIAGTHYFCSGNSVTIPKGFASATERFPTVSDSQATTPKTLTVNIGGDPAYFIGLPSSAGLTISYRPAY